MNAEKENCEEQNLSWDLFDDSDEDFICSKNQENQAMMDCTETVKRSTCNSFDSKEDTSSFAQQEQESNQIKIQSEMAVANVAEKPSSSVDLEKYDNVSTDCNPHRPKRHKNAECAESSDQSLSELYQGKSLSSGQLSSKVSTENDCAVEQPRHSSEQNSSTDGSISIDKKSSQEDTNCKDKFATAATTEANVPELTCPFCCVTETCVLLLEHHIFTAHPDLSDSENGAHSISKEQANSATAFLFVCPLCDMDLETEPALATHFNTAHLEEENLTDLEAVPSLSCPLCAASFVSAEEMVTHVKSHENDSTYYGASGNSPESHAMHFTASQDLVCPMCGRVMDDPDLLTSHVETHFSPHHRPCDNDVGAVNKENIPVKQITNGHVGSAEHKASVSRPSTSYSASSSQDQSSSSALSSRDVSSYRRQYERSLEQDVWKGKISVADYHEQRAGMQGRDLKGVDDGHSRVDGLIEQLTRLYRQQARPGQRAYFCSPTSHFSGSHGDKGWGCGYRNFQMMLSCLANQSQYADKIFKDGRLLIPSVPKVQQMIESAWSKGFDPDGCRQLRGQLVNTQKWIGATEIVATLASLGIRCCLADFHAPSAADGTHPRLLEWVTDYFTGRQNQQFTPPLYLQHQGHSRTIVGVEIDRGTIRLLLFDPGSKKDHIANLSSSGLNWKSMRTFRRTQLAFKAKQYQIVAVDGILTQREYEESKIIKSERIS